MCDFIEDYLNNPSQAIASAVQKVQTEEWFDTVDEDMIYRELASPQFRLYEEIIMSSANENTPHASGYAVVA